MFWIIPPLTLRVPPGQVQPASRVTGWKEKPKLADVALESAALMEPTLSAALVPLAERLAGRETGLQLVNEKGWSVSAGGVRLVTVLNPCCPEESLHR